MSTKKTQWSIYFITYFIIYFIILYLYETDIVNGSIQYDVGPEAFGDSGWTGESGVVREGKSCVCEWHRWQDRLVWKGVVDGVG